MLTVCKNTVRPAPPANLLPQIVVSERVGNFRIHSNYYGPAQCGLANKE